MELSKPKPDTGEVPKSPSATQTSKLRSSEEPMEDKAEQPPEEDFVSLEMSCDEGELSSVSAKDEQTRNVTPVEASGKCNKDKQDLCTDVEQQKSSTSNEDDSSQIGNDILKNSADRLEGSKRGNSVRYETQENPTDISHENVGQTLSQTNEEQERPENVTPKKSAAVQILEQIQTGEKQVSPVKDAVQQTEVPPKDGDAGQTLSETTQEQPQPTGNGTSKTTAEIKARLQENLLTRDKQDTKGAQEDCNDIVEISLLPGAKGEKSDEVEMLTSDKQVSKGVPKDLNNIVEVSVQAGAKPGVNNLEEERTDAQEGSSQRDEDQSEKREKEGGSSSESSGVKVPEKNSQQVATAQLSSTGNVKMAVSDKNMKSINLSQIQTVTSASGQKYSMIQKTSEMGSPIYESVDTKEQYYWVPQSSLSAAKLSGISEGLRLGKHFALIPLEKGKSLKLNCNVLPVKSYRMDELRKKTYKDRERPRERSCDVPGCHSSSYAFPNLGFFRFPKTEPRYVQCINV